MDITCISLIVLSREDMLGMTKERGQGSVRVMVWSRSTKVGSLELSFVHEWLDRWSSWLGKGSELWYNSVRYLYKLWLEGGHYMTFVGVLKGKCVS